MENTFFFGGNNDDLDDFGRIPGIAKRFDVENQGTSSMNRGASNQKWRESTIFHPNSNYILTNPGI